MTTNEPKRRYLASKANALPTKPLIEKKLMPKSTKPKVPEKADDKEQSEAFIKAAQESGTSDDPEAFERAFRAVASSKPAKTKKRQSAK